MSLIESIIIGIIVGVVSGIVTYFFILILVRIFTNLVIPWYQSVVYRGSKIDGTWYGYTAKEENGDYAYDLPHSSIINLSQKADKITGDMLMIRHRSGEDRRKLFTINGFFYDNNLVINLKVADKKRVGGGTGMMRLGEDGEKLKGKHVYISSHDLTKIFTEDQVWIRHNA